MFIGGINMSKKLLPDDSKLIELYVKDKKSCKEICRMYGLSVNSSSNLGVKLKKLGIEIADEECGCSHSCGNCKNCSCHDELTITSEDKINE